MTLWLRPEQSVVNLPVQLGERFALAGDWHGNTTHVTQVLHALANEGVRAVVQLGDFGLWPGPAGERYLRELQTVASRCGVSILWLDGNHEDFTQLAATPLDPRYRVHRFSEHIWHLPRGARFTVETNDGAVRFCAVGGATSLDRASRVPGVSWWAEEEITAEQVYQIGLGGETDVLLSHDCPAGVEIPGIVHRTYSRQWPMRELERAWEHRERLAELAHVLRPTHIFHGHFHSSYESETGAFGVRTLVTGLSDDGSSMANIQIIESAELGKDVARRRSIQPDAVER